MNIQCKAKCKETFISRKETYSKQTFICTTSEVKCKETYSKQTFICTTSEVKCKEHAEAKLPENDLFQCFPPLQE